MNVSTRLATRLGDRSKRNKTNWFLQEKCYEKKENENHSVNNPIQLEDLRGI